MLRPVRLLALPRAIVDELAAIAAFQGLLEAESKTTAAHAELVDGHILMFDLANVSYTGDGEA